MPLPTTMVRPAAWGSLLFLGGADAKLYDYSQATGAQVWNFTAGGAITVAPAVSASGTVLVAGGDFDGRIYALAAVNGSALWKWNLATKTVLPCGHGGPCYLATKTVLPGGHGGPCYGAPTRTPTHKRK